jgi:hypothetical protein
VEAWSANGHIAYLVEHDNIQDIWAKPMSGDGKAFPVVPGPFRKDEPQFSFDGKWLAYAAETGGAFQVYVTSFPKADQTVQISKDGGSQPRWRRDGKELYYRDVNDASIVAVSIAVGADGRLQPGRPELLLVGPMMRGLTVSDPTRHQLAVDPDGKRFLLRVPPPSVGNAARGNFGERSGVPQVVPFTSDTIGNRGGNVRGTGGGRGIPALQSNGLTVVWRWTSALGKAAE